MPLARQLLALQTMIVVVVLLVVVLITWVQAASDFRRSAGNRALGLAETFATDSRVRGGLSGQLPPEVVVQAATRTQSVSGVDFVVVLDEDGRVVASQDGRPGRPWDLTASTLHEGRAWVGAQDLDGRSSVQAHVPVLDAVDVVELGSVVVGFYQPSIATRLRTSVPDLAIYLGVASFLGIAGSLLLARRIKRQTFGLEPREIAGMIEHREALLRGIREGVLGLDLSNRVTLLNAEARMLLDLGEDATGHRVADLGLPRDVVRALVTDTSLVDQVIVAGSRVLSLNRMPVTARGGQSIGSVVTLRDRTELLELRDELAVLRNAAESMRAQTHEFSNRLHTISGLLRLGRPERAQEYVLDLQAGHNQFLRAVTSRIDDATVAALVVAKGSVASERGVELRIADTTCLGVVALDVAADLETIIGNFIDNALDAVSGTSDAWVELALEQHAERVDVRVCDSGPGVDPEVLDSVFQSGVSTKSRDGQRGIGLSLARLVCERRGGRIDVCNDEGAVFTASFALPQRPQ